MPYGPGHSGTDDSGWATEIGERICRAAGLVAAEIVVGFFKGFCYTMGGGVAIFTLLKLTGAV